MHEIPRWFVFGPFTSPFGRINLMAKPRTFGLVDGIVCAILTTLAKGSQRWKKKCSMQRVWVRSSLHESEGHFLHVAMYGEKTSGAPWKRFSDKQKSFRADIAWMWRLWEGQECPQPEWRRRNTKSRTEKSIIFLPCIIDESDRRCVATDKRNCVQCWTNTQKNVDLYDGNQRPPAHVRSHAAHLQIQ